MNAYPKFNIGFWADGAFIIKPYEKPKIMYSADLTSGTVLPSFLTLSRLSAATRFDSTGNLVDAAIDEPRFDYGYNGTNWVNQGLLIEKQSTNYALNNVAIYSGNSGAGISDTLLGNNKAYKASYLAAQTTTPKFIAAGTADLTSGTHTLSVYVQASTRFLQLRSDAVFAQGFTNFDLESILYNTRAGAGGSKPISARILKMNQAYLISHTILGNALGASRGDKFHVNLSGSIDAERNAPNGAGGDLKILGYQVELGTTKTSTIFSSANASTTRSPDNLQLNLSDYTGSIKLDYKRQDTEVVESTWIDLTNATNPIISSSLSVGIWLQSIAVYNRTLTAQEKANA